MSTKSEWFGGILTFFDKSTYERVLPVAPCRFYDDFLGTDVMFDESGSNGPWTALDVSSSGNSTPIIAADVANGVCRLPLDNTSEAQESGIYWGDQRPLVLNQGLIFEARVALQTLPTGVSEAVWGLAGDYNADPDTVAEGIWFKADGDGIVVVESDDGTIETDDEATGVTLTAELFAICRIDCTDIEDIKFYINGARVAGTATIDASTVPTLALQPYFHISKSTGTTLGVLDVDYVRVWQKRS